MRLRPDVKVEPLVDRWHAWPHLLLPAQQALNLAFRYLPTVKSFVTAPAVHIAAAANPAMFGGPFLELPATALEQAKRWIAETETGRARALRFARDFREFDVKLQSLDGFSLDQVRERTPPSLTGLVELVYSLNNHAKIRFLEAMFETDDLGHREAQGVMLHDTPNNQRKFFLSTPRLDGDGTLFVKAAFDSAAVEALGRARYRDVDLDEIAALLGHAAADLAPYFTEGSGSSSRAPYAGAGVRVSYFGHACLLIESASLTILVDPTGAYEKEAGRDHLTLHDLPDRIDILFLSHGHQDHLTPEILIQLRERVGTVLIPPSNSGDPADPSLKRMLRSLGFKSIVTLDPLDRYQFTDGAITSLPFTGEHCDLDVHSKHCALIELKGRRICLFIDSDVIDLDVYQRILDRLQRPDIMFVGMECFGAPLSWLYGPLFTAPIPRKNDESRRLSGATSARAGRLAEAIRPQRAFVYAMGQEPWMRYLMGLAYHEDSPQLKEVELFLGHCRNLGIEAEHLYLNKVVEI
ncbi:MAG TPA: MBL fold metallo-hydrolase [Allosphingosinicella sp.]